MAAPGAPFNRGVFVGSNSALFAGQSLGDIYLSNFFAPPTILAPFHARLTVEVIGPSIIGFIIEITITAPGNPMAVWVPAPVWLMFQLQVVHIQNVSKISIPRNWCSRFLGCPICRRPLDVRCEAAIWVGSHDRSRPPCRSLGLSSIPTSVQRISLSQSPPSSS